MMLSPWFQYELGKQRIERALEERERDRQARRVRGDHGPRPKLGAALGIAVLIRQALKLLFTARRQAAGL